MSSTAIHIHQRERFEDNVLRGLGAGAVVGAVNVMPVANWFPLSFVALSAVTLACAQFERKSLRLLGALLPMVVWGFELAPAWTIGLAGAVVGAVIVRSLMDDGRNALGAERITWWHVAGGAALTAALALAGNQVALVLGAQLRSIQTPLLLIGALKGAVFALFAAIGSLVGHMGLRADPVETQCEQVISQLNGEFLMQAEKALVVYRACGQALASLPREPAREELARTIQRLVKETMTLASEWAGVEAQLKEAEAANLELQVNELRESANQAADAVAKKQLELAAMSLEEEVANLAEMKLKRERVLAKAKSHVALLERARMSLIGMKSSHASVRAAELSAASRKLNALALSQTDEARLAHAVATSTELSSSEKQRLDEQARAQFKASELQPVSAAVSSDEEDETEASAEQTQSAPAIRAVS